MKAEWSSVLMDTGEQFAQMAGMTKMQLWYANSLVLKLEVSIHTHTRYARMHTHTAEPNL